MTRTWQPPRRPDHNRVEPGDAIGVAIRIPVEHHDVVVDLLAPHIDRSLVEDQQDFITVYPTTGRDLLNGRPVRHCWVNVLADPPAAVPHDDAIGGLACIGAPSNLVNRMWWRHGLGRVPGQLRLTLDRAKLHATVRIATEGGLFTAIAGFESEGEGWAALPQHYYLLDPDRRRLLTGDEWGTRHDGRGSVTFVGPRGETAFETYVGLDLDLGWDYLLGTIR
jgi:DNA-binding transcriptional LysR family regulator